jgi:hypothetical protein
MTRGRIFILVLAAILLLPLWMWLAWLLTPKTKLVVAIVDKTVLDQSAQEHISLNWVLNNNRFTKTSALNYQIDHDYFGFFPSDSEKYRIKGLERFSSEQLKQLSTDADAAYFTDTYGIYRNEWFRKVNINERSPILYGGMSAQDIEFLRDMKAAHKLVITEFNSIGSPTTVDMRNKFEQLFGMHWTGWTARYFDNLDTTTNRELPRWLIHNYKDQHEHKWPFHKAGIAFVSNLDQVFILQDSTHLTDPVPHIITTAYGRKNLSLPESMKYPYWFDIISPDLSINHVVSRFELKLKPSGLDELKKYNVPATFPAIIMHNDKDYQFYYFSGDFCDNPISLGTSYFKGIGFFKGFFYNDSNRAERQSFFWNFYRPLVTNILEQKARGKK